MADETETPEQRQARLSAEARAELDRVRRERAAAEAAQQQQQRQQQQQFSLPGALAPTEGELQAAQLYAAPDDTAAQSDRERVARAQYRQQNPQRGLLESVVEGAKQPLRKVAEAALPIASALMPGALSTGGPIVRMETPTEKQDEGIAGRDKGAMADDWYSRLGEEPPGGAGAGVGGLFAGTGAYAAQVKAPKYEMSKTLEGAYDTQEGGYKELAKATDEFLDSPERARVLGEAEAAKKKYAADEEGRFEETKGVTRRSKALESEAARVAGLKIDPEAMMGRGLDRARTTFALSIANVLGNVGEAMQGKAATNAVLGIVRDMIAQNIGMQQQDRQFELQGLAARQSALGRTAAALKDESLAAKAVLSGQLGFYDAELERISRGMRDQEARNVLTQAQGKVREAKGQVDQQLMNATTAGQFQADLANAQMATSAAIQRANARVESAKAQSASMLAGIPEGEAKFIGEQVFKPAREAKLSQRYEILKQLQEFAKDPENRKAIESASGWVATLRKNVGKDMDAGALRSYIANMSAEQFSDSRERQFFDLIRQYEASKMGGQAGKAITGFEAYIYSPSQVFNVPTLQRMIEEEHRYNLRDKRDLAGIAMGFRNVETQRALKAGLEQIYPEQLAPAPMAPAQPGPMRTQQR